MAFSRCRHPIPERRGKEYKYGSKGEQPPAAIVQVQSSRAEHAKSYSYFCCRRANYFLYRYEQVQVAYNNYPAGVQ